MRDLKLVSAIRRLKVETGSLACMGCGHAQLRRVRMRGHAGGRRPDRQPAHPHRGTPDGNLEVAGAERAAALVAKESAELLEQRWIPVTERLPEDRSNVLVVAYWHERWGVYMGWCAPERAKWSVHVGIGDRDDVAVTHWMPLPEPPEVENAETK